VFKSVQQAASQAVLAEGCFERSLASAVKVTVAQVIGNCLPKNSRVVELSWWSIQCSVFDENGD
jgi:hypothetical protein